MNYPQELWGESGANSFSRALFNRAKVRQLPAIEKLILSGSHYANQ